MKNEFIFFFIMLKTFMVGKMKGMSDTFFIMCKIEGMSCIEKLVEDPECKEKEREVRRWLMNREDSGW